MCFTGGGAEDVPAERTAWSVAMHGADTPFRHWTVMRRYVAGLFARLEGEREEKSGGGGGGVGGLVDVCYGTCVERAVKEGEEWVLTLRREEEEEKKEGEDAGGGADLWYEERFDAVVVASGHFNVPWIPPVEGLDEFERSRPGSVLHSKMYRGREDFRGKVRARSPACLDTDNFLFLFSFH